MAAAKISENDVDALLTSCTLAVTGNYRWTRGDNKFWSKITIPVQSGPRNVSLKICITVNPREPERRNFVLLWNKIRVRALCMAGSHTNKHTNAEQWTRQVHKHKWKDNCQDRFAYTPTDITATDLQGQFSQFCAECGISCSAAVPDVPLYQGDLYDEL